MKRLSRTLLLCAWIAVSQHQSTDGLWWRQEAGPITEQACRLLLKQATGRPKVGVLRWHDVTTQQLEKQFSATPAPDKGTWLGCWPEGARLGEPDS